MASRMYEGMGFVRVPELDFQSVDGVMMRSYRLDMPAITPNTVA